MEEIQLQSEIIRIKIDNVDVFLEEMGGNKGKITISDTYDHNYSYFWGAMSGTLRDFILSINKEYFADKLLGHRSNYEMDVPKTFAAIRKHISQELGLYWYQHMEFQKEMRDSLNYFQRQCMDIPDQRYFVDNFYSCFVNNLPYHMIEGNRARDFRDVQEMEQLFKDGFTEHWNFITEKPGKEYLWLTNLHGKLKSKLKKAVAAV